MVLIPPTKVEHLTNYFIQNFNGQTFSSNEDVKEWLWARLAIFADDIARETWEHIKTVKKLDNLDLT